MIRNTVTTWAKRGRGAWLAPVVAALALVPSGCGGSSGTRSPATDASSAPVHRTVTPTTRAELARFTRHAGLAFGIFHRYVYGPVTGGAPKSPARRERAFANASAAASAAAHEIGLAKRNASQSTALRKLFGPLAALQPTLAGVATALERGHSDPAGLRAANIAIASIEQSGSVGGVKIAERSSRDSP